MKILTNKEYEALKVDKSIRDMNRNRLNDAYNKIENLEKELELTKEAYKGYKIKLENQYKDRTEDTNLLISHFKNLILKYGSNKEYVKSYCELVKLLRNL